MHSLECSLRKKLLKAEEVAERMVFLKKIEDEAKTLASQLLNGDCSSYKNELIAAHLNTKSKTMDSLRSSLKIILAQAEKELPYAIKNKEKQNEARKKIGEIKQKI